ncbi:OmpA family protein [Arsenicibacter rosenii]|uniref:OmpA-like domain-containing protein n=1 Tax=Arsenicibacter rosenii TaxID=1750698 RepID=A0A1S2VJM3_9BACT|nr:OmpA family protein [Arsenicibacter rosenii]OIN58406.1 hypothetical protein BLX24_15555 [Arsenicibacter rosenii]
MNRVIFRNSAHTIGWFCLWLMGWIPVSGQNGQPSLASVEGVIVDRQTGQPIAYATLSVLNEQGQTVARQQTPVNGTFRVRLSPKQRYTVDVQAEGYQTEQDVLDFTVPYVNHVTGKRFKLSPVARVSGPMTGSSALSVYFMPRSAALTTVAVQALQSLLTRLQGSKEQVVLIGYTDGQGDAVLNELLAGDRAEAVRSFLIGNGILNERIRINQAGNKADLNTALPQKRRVDIVVE